MRLRGGTLNTSAVKDLLKHVCCRATLLTVLETEITLTTLLIRQQMRRALSRFSVSVTLAKDNRE